MSELDQDAIDFLLAQAAEASGSALPLADTATAPASVLTTPVPAPRPAGGPAEAAGPIHRKPRLVMRDPQQQRASIHSYELPTFPSAPAPGVVAQAQVEDPTQVAARIIEEARLTAAAM